MEKFIKTLKDGFDTVRSSFEPKAHSPDELLGELFHDVQIRRIYPDEMTFVDMIPAKKLENILSLYKQQRHDPAFELGEFIQKHFQPYMQSEAGYEANKSHSVEQHINALWPIMRRHSIKSNGSLIGLPKPYIVAGGRFITQYYWDSYFIMLGLAVAKDWRMVENMTKNCAYLLRKYGFVPNGNRTYFTSRSQPPVFALMVRLLASREGNLTYVRYLPALLNEYKFWMKGAKDIKGKPAADRVVKLPGGELLNRYYDNKSTPRPESYKEDVVTAIGAAKQPSRVYLGLRAAAESGWDFSSRWLADGKTLEKIVTTDIVPIDLNCLLVLLEETIATAYEVLHNQVVAKKYRRAAQARKQAINKYMWNEKKGFYLDYNFVKGEQTKVVSCAAFFALFSNLASDEQAKKIVMLARRELLKPGGLLTTTVNTGQQWDSPNGWAPLQWVAIKGLRAYGFDELANDIRRRWLLTVEKTYKAKGKLVEKYNVLEPTKPAGGGEYVLQDGFGWTNGVQLALLHEEELKLG